MTKSAKNFSNNYSDAKNRSDRRSNFSGRPAGKFTGKKDTSWQKVAGWYSRSVGKKGSFHHTKTIIPKSLELLNIKSGQKVLDLACGQGVLARSLQAGVHYVGIDLAQDLIQEARNLSGQRPNTQFIHADVTVPLQLPAASFDAATIILALQNVKEPSKVFSNAAALLKPRAKLLIVLNHPYFRIPRQSGWGINEQSKTQYRWVSRYLSPLEIPIDMTPGQKQKKTTWSYHHSLSDYSKMLLGNGFVITTIAEWPADKESVGKNSKMENLARAEIPLFMAIVAEKR